MTNQERIEHFQGALIHTLSDARAKAASDLADLHAAVEAAKTGDISGALEFIAQVDRRQSEVIRAAAFAESIKAIRRVMDDV